MGAREKALYWMGDQAADIVDEILAQHRQEIAQEIRAGIQQAREADWGKSRGKIAYIQGMGQARRIAEGKPCSPTP